MTSSRPAKTPSRGEAALRLAGGLAAAVGMSAALVGFLLSDALALATSAGLIGFWALTMDASNARKGDLSPMTLYVFTWTLASFANAVAILNQDTDKRASYFLYAIDENLVLAMQIAWMGLVMPLIGFRWVTSSSTWRTLVRLPQIRGTIADRHLLWASVAAAAIGIGAHAFPGLRSLGTLTAIVYFFPHLASFALARVGVMRNWPTAVWTALGIAVLESVRALLSAYLRADIGSPIFAYAAGVLMGLRSLRGLRSRYMIPVYAAAVPFVVYFAAFAEARTRSVGVLRLEEVQRQQLALVEEGQSSSQNLVARLSNFNQLSQVVRVVREDGYLGGETLEYLAYAWIPRFVWPEKPKIAKGAWFAYRIGQARIHEGRITNSVNMTIPGEFFMNFGWIGLIIGPLAFGAVFALFWQATRFWERPFDTLASAFGFYLLWLGVFGGADLQVIVTIVAVYLVFLAASQFVGGRETVGPRGERRIVTHQARPA